MTIRMTHNHGEMVMNDIVLSAFIDQDMYMASVVILRIQDNLLQVINWG